MVLEQIQNPPIKQEVQNSGSVLKLLRISYLIEAADSWDKDRVPQIVTLLRDGESIDEAQEAAGMLKEDGVVYLVGIKVLYIHGL